MRHDRVASCFRRLLFGVRVCIPQARRLDMRSLGTPAGESKALATVANAFQSEQSLSFRTHLTYLVPLKTSASFDREASVRESLKLSESRRFWCTRGRTGGHISRVKLGVGARHGCPSQVRAA